MGAPDEEIERKLIELESSLREPPRELSVNSKSTQPTVNNDDAAKADLNITVGWCLLALGILLVFNHVRIGTSFFAGLFGGMSRTGFGYLLIPFIVGIGIILYDYKKRVGWIITAMSCALLFFAILSQLIMTFPSTSLLGLMFMLLPLAAGGALLAKGMTQKSRGAK